MKKLTIILCLQFITLNLLSQQTSFPKLNGPYLGQKPPGMTPEVFAPGIVSTLRNEHCPAAFSPENDEVFWSATDGQRFFLFRSYMDNGVWTLPSIPDFTHGLDATNPVFAVDGEKLFFVSQVVENRQWVLTLWYVEKTATGWSERKKVEEISSFGKIGYQVSFTADGTIYFSSEKDGGFGGKDIYKSEYVNGAFSQPENLGNVINSNLWEESVYISPVESFILFRRHAIGENNIFSDFYISYNENGDWTEPILFTDKLGIKGDGQWVGVSPDQKYLFFIKKGIANQYTQNGSDMFWVDAKIIEELRQKE